jgi:WD40 repeat protein
MNDHRSSASPAEEPTIKGEADSHAGAAVEGPRSFGDYEQLVEIARGGMGVVFRAKQTSLNRLVALKMILAGGLAGPADLERFRREAEAAGNLDHPNIVPIYEVGEHQGQQYFSMKLVEGGNLTGRLAEFLRDPRAAVRLVATVARAVHHAHQRGVLHRDLKPGNVLLDAEGQPHVTDFGLAKWVKGDAGLTQSGAIVGTPGYMAPEQAAAAKVLTTAVDVYSLGAILYELLTGRPPFVGETALETVMQVIDREPTSPRSLDARIDRDLETVVLKCLEKDPQRRYGSAEALAEDLDRWLRGEPVQARPVGGWERLRRWCGRNPALTALTIATCLALIAGIAVSSYFAIEANGEARAARNAEKTADEERNRARQQQQVAVTNERQARNHLYLSNMMQAGMAWRLARVERVRELLAAQLPERIEGGHDFRHFEWYYLDRLCHSELRSLSGHRGTVSAVAWSPDGQWIASGGGRMGAGEVTLSEAITGFFFNLPDHKEQVQSVVFSADGKYLASVEWPHYENGRMRGTCRIWDTATRKLLATLDGYGCAAFSPDGRQVAVGARGDRGRLVVVWDWTTGKEVGSVPENAGGYLLLHSVAFSPDGNRLALGGDAFTGLLGAKLSTVRVWDLPAGTLAQKFVHDGGVDAVAYSPDGQRLASAGGDGKIHLWDLATHKEIRALAGHSHRVSSVVYSLNGKLLVSGSEDGTLRIWDAVRGEQLNVIRGHGNMASGVAISPDNRAVVSGSPDGTVKVWDTLKNQEGLRLSAWASALAFHPDGRRLATVDRTVGVRIWDCATGERRSEGLPPAVWGTTLAATYSRDGEQLIRVNQSLLGQNVALTIHSATTGKLSASIPLHVAFSLQSAPLLAVDPSSDRIAMTTLNEVQVWDLKAKQKVFSWAWDDRATRFRCLTFSPDGRWLAAASWNSKTIKLWDTIAGKEGRVFADLGPIAALQFLPDSKQLAVVVSNRLILLSPVMGDSREFNLAPLDFAAVSPDGRRLATVDSEGTMLLWDTATGQQLLSLSTPMARVDAITFSPNNRRLVVAGVESKFPPGFSGRFDFVTSAVWVWNATSPDEARQPVAPGR